ncbi:MAG: type I DNA topoisomerase [Anaerolineae bacterium]
MVIVESPTKARTIGRFLGQGYTVRASMGHVRDLPKSRLGVDIEHDFEPQYVVPQDKKATVKELKDLVASADEIYLATDPDREGEAIAWHLLEATGADPARVRRVVFHEITAPAIKEAFAHPRGINAELTNAQEARRILDRLVGYQISPLLWTRVQKRLSAGRVQSVAVRLVVEREREIQAFVPVEYWSIEAELAKRVPQRPTFRAKLARIDGQDVDLKDRPATYAVVADLEGASYAVQSVKEGQRRRSPQPPFTTSTLQQEASRKLGMGPRRTMALAQQLYEGLDVGGEGRVGLITYMRTDSVQVSSEAQREAREYIRRRYGEAVLPESPPVYRSRGKNAQEAHEAIRPTSVLRDPQVVKPYLERDQFRVYELIWQRFVASQMAPAVYDTMTVEVKAGRPSAELFSSQAEIPSLRSGQRPRGSQARTGATSRTPAQHDERAHLTELPLGTGLVPADELERWRYLFRASGARLRERGFLAVYEEGRDEGEPAEEEGPPLPPLQPGELVDLLELIPEQHFTQPPARYTEATLVKALEAFGIGRPSTYAPILSNIQDRGYVERRDRHLYPTELGFVVNDLLVAFFGDILNTGFTSLMEEDLDRIVGGERDRVQVLREFYEPFSQSLQRAQREMPKVELTPETTDELCEMCGRPMVVKHGRFGKFLGCSGFPDCRTTRPFLVKVGVACPRCGGEIVQKRSKNRRIFYGCARYPACEFTSWKRPVPRPCPRCGGVLVEARKGYWQCLACEALTPAGEGEEHVAPAEAAD